MIKIGKNFNSISCNTRLNYQFSKDKNRFTASDVEIFTDLTELKKLSQSIDRNIITTEETQTLPQKRKKSLKDSTKNLPTNEDEVISALASLIHQNHQRNHSMTPKKIFESNIKELIKVVLSKPHQALDEKLKVCRSSVKLNSKASKIQKIIKNRSRAALRLFE